ncbi:MAG: RluA family pseudouridine synthase [Oscillospiraceae bacterium]
MRTIEYTVSESENGTLTEHFLRHRGYSARMLSRLRRTGGITRNGLLLRTVDALCAGDTVTVTIPEEGESLVPNPALKAAVMYEDEDIVVFDKPYDMPVHPSIEHYSDTLGNLFAALYPDCAFRPLNRLDKDTSGLCVCAKNAYAAAAVQKTLRKTYFGVISGELCEKITIDKPIAREQGSIIRRCADPSGKPAVTIAEPILRANGHTLVKFTLLTGRTHQIRVHISSEGMPLCGDAMYGGDCSGISRQALHCGEVTFTGAHGEVTARSQLPADMAGLLDKEIL